MGEVSGWTIMWDYHLYVKTLLSGRTMKEVEAEVSGSIIRQDQDYHLEALAKLSGGKIKQTCFFQVKIIRWDYHLEATAEALSGTISNDIGIKWDYQVGLPFEKHFLMGPIVPD